MKSILCHLSSIFLLSIACVIFIPTKSLSQSLEWKFLPNGTISNTCVSNSDPINEHLCYGLEYTPDHSGELTSATLGFFIECDGVFNPPLSIESCVLTDNQFVQDACQSSQLIFLQPSSVSPPLTPGASMLTAGQKIILGQVCFDYHWLDTIRISRDPITSITMSINTTNGFETDEIIFPSTKLFYSIGVEPCTDSVECSINFAINDGDISINNLPSGKITEGDTLNNNDRFSQSFDVYDDVNYFCGQSGGLADFTLDIEMIHTQDVYGGGTLNNNVGSSMFTIQDTNGITGFLPFGSSGASTSSSGDVRGYRLDVSYHDHISILAEDLSVILSNANQANSIFESAVVVFYGEEGLPLGNYTYNGFYLNGADLSGNCNLSPTNALPYNICGGVFAFQTVSTVDLSSPCLPNSGSSTPLVSNINASTDAGIDPSKVISGFTVIILGEDIAASSITDDGSGLNGDDGVAGNMPTSTNTNMVTSVMGFEVLGCVFGEKDEKPFELKLEASPGYVAVGDTIRYDATLTNISDTLLQNMDLSIELSQYVLGPYVTSVGGSVTSNTANYNNINIAQGSSTDHYVRGYVSPLTPSSLDLFDLVEAGSYFQPSLVNGSNTPWEISSTFPKSGIKHWYVSSSSDFSLKDLYLSDPIAPTSSSVMSFWHRYDTEPTKDGGVVEISIDGGVTWIDLSPYFTSNGYNSYILGDPASSAFSGNSGNYIQSVIDLSAFENQLCFIRFRLVSDCSGSQDGWYLDDLYLSNLNFTFPAYAQGILGTDTITSSTVVVPQLVLCTDVYTTLDSGQGSLRRAVSCANSIDTILFLPPVFNDTIELTGSIQINKDLLITGGGIISIDQMTDNTLIHILSGGRLDLRDMRIIHQGQVTSTSLLNEGELIIEDVIIQRNTNGSAATITNIGVMSAKGTNILKQ